VLPTRAEFQAVFADQLNRFAFPPSEVSAWSVADIWTRQAVLAFATPAAERAGHGVPVDPATLPATELRVLQRSGPVGPAYQVVQQVAGALTNYLPVFHGSRSSFTFDDSVTGPARLTCRRIGQYLACRAIEPAARRVSYQTFGPAAGTPEPAPSKRALLARFAGRRSWAYAAAPVTAWRPAVSWRRVAAMQFTAGTDERVAEPFVINPVPIPKELWLFRRLVAGRTQVGIVAWVDRAPVGGTALLNLFPVFTGDLHRFVFYDTGVLIGQNYQETCRRYWTDGTEYLLCRTILQGQAVFYQTYLRA
jgi:hypothetical protein